MLVSLHRRSKPELTVLAKWAGQLALRELTTDDVDAVHAIYSDPLVTEHLSFASRTREEVSGVVARSIASAAARRRIEARRNVVD